MAGSKTNGFETAFLEHYFNNSAIANVGDASGLPASATAGSLYVALFTADPGETGAFTNEATFTGYARVAVARSAGGWTVSGNNASNTAAITFAECTAGSETISHFGICRESTGGVMDYHGDLTTSRAVSSGVTLEFAAGELDVTED